MSFGNSIVRDVLHRRLSKHEDRLAQCDVLEVPVHFTSLAPKLLYAGSLDNTVRAQSSEGFSIGQTIALGKHKNVFLVQFVTFPYLLHRVCGPAANYKYVTLLSPRHRRRGGEFAAKAIR